MAELFDECREEPRFETQGNACISAAECQQAGKLQDLSLNGFRMELDQPPSFKLGDHIALELSCAGDVSFRGEGVIVHCAEQHLGIEFWNMSTDDFEALTKVISHLRDQGLSAQP